MYHLTHHKATPFQMFLLSQVEALVAICPALLRPLVAIFDRLQDYGDLFFRIYDRLEYLSWRAGEPDDVYPATNLDDEDELYQLDLLAAIERDDVRRRQRWNSLSPEQQAEIYEEVQEMCIDGNRDAGDHWAYPFLRESLMSGYVGD